MVAASALPARRSEGPPGLRARSDSLPRADRSPRSGRASSTRTADAPVGAGPGSPRIAASPPASPGPADLVDLLAAFAHEPDADCFNEWVMRMVSKVPAWNTPHVRAGTHMLVQRMAQDAGLRAECFGIAREYQGFCVDRPLAGYHRMQAELLASRAAAGELSTAGLHDASVRLFNRHALEAFASEHARRQGRSHESVEAALYLEIQLRDRLALPPVATVMHGAPFAVESIKIDAAVLNRAVAHVRALHRNTAEHGLPAFLAGLGAAEFNPWVEHLRGKFPQDFEDLNQRVGDRLEARTRKLGGTAAAREQAGVECKAQWTRETVGLVARLSRTALAEVGVEVDAGVQCWDMAEWLGSRLHQVLQRLPLPWRGPA